MNYRDHLMASAYEASLLGQVLLPADYLQLTANRRFAIARRWYNDLLKREAAGDEQAKWILHHFPNLRYRGEIPFEPAPRRRGLPSVALIGPVAYVGGAEQWCETLVAATKDRINWRGFGITGSGSIDPIMLERWQQHAVPIARGEDQVRRLCSIADITVTWGVGKLRALVPRDKFLISVSHSPKESTWARELHFNHKDAVNAWVAVSRIALGAIPVGYRRGCKVIPNGVDPQRVKTSKARRERFRRKWGVGPEQRVVGMLGRVSLEKDVSALLRAVKALPRRYVGISLGDNTMDHLGLREAAEKTKGRVQILPPVLDVGGALSAFDVVLGASEYESFWLAGVEALMAHRPLVSTKVGFLCSAPDLARLIPYGAPGAVIAEAILADERDPEGTAERVARAGQVARERWGVEAFGDAWASYLEAVADGSVERRLRKYPRGA